MSALLFRLGGVAAAHPWRTIAAWLAVLAVAVGLSLAVGGQPRDDYRVAGSPAQVGADFLAENFDGTLGSGARVVVHAENGTVDPAGLAALGDRLRALPHVTGVEPARMSADGDTALLSVHYGVPVTAFDGSEAVDALWTAAAELEGPDVQIALGGEVPENFAPPSGTAELIGIGVALVILVFAFGSVIAAGLPLAVALIGLGVGSSLITVLAGFSDVSNTAPTIATMVGIGVGIDYALLLVTRYVEGLRAGLPVRAAAARANGTAGVSVVFAGTTVLVCLLGLRLAGLPVYTSVGVATLLVVTAVMLTSITLVPALCSLAGTRVLRRAERRKPVAATVVSVPNATATTIAATTVATATATDNANDLPDTATARWAARIGRRPVPYALAALALLLLLAAPVLGMRTWPQDAGSGPDSATTRIAYDLVGSEYGAGANGPFLLAVDLDRLPADRLPQLAERISADAGVASVTPAVINDTATAALLVVEPVTGPQDEQTVVLIDRLRSELPDSVMVTGLTPAFADISERLSERLWVVIAFVVGLSLLLMTAVFRSVVVAVKAAVMNLLSVAAAYGVMVVVFQWGWGAQLLGLPHAVPVSSWVPILMFTILFGLSMDYQVFLLSRIREDYLATGEPRRSVVRGLASTGRVITSAAAIMIAVFIGFALDADPTVKMMGVGMATAVLIDATVVRMVLVPATMSLLGPANWWLPSWLDRILPRLDVDGQTDDVIGAGPARSGDGTRVPEPV
jgi:RND superfamily putative drug exporter